MEQRIQVRHRRTCREARSEGTFICALEAGAPQLKVESIISGGNRLNTEELKQLLDACFLARHLVDTLPELPGGMKPRHVHVLDMIYQINLEQNCCRVSDVCARMRITMPSITRLIQELEAMDMVEKYSDERDRRVTLLRLTAPGADCVQRHVLEFHSQWASQLSDIDSSQIRNTISVIHKMYDTMPVVRTSPGARNHQFKKGDTAK